MSNMTIENNKKAYQHPLILITIAFIYKLCFFILLLPNNNQEVIGFWGETPTDSQSYISPIENFIENGNYTPDYRMPGLGIMLFPFLYIFKKHVALNLFIVFQLIITAISSYVLSLIASKIFNSKRISMICFIVAVLSTYQNTYDTNILTESLCISFLIFSVYFLLKSSDSKKNIHILISGIFLTEVIFLRPVYIPLLAIFSIYLLLLNFKRNKLLSIKLALLFILPFFVIDGIWIARNFNKHKRIIPLTKTVYYPHVEDSYWRAAIKFVQAWGGDYQYWLPNAEIRWFTYKLKNGPGHSIRQLPNELPNYIYTSQFNRDSLLGLVNLMVQLENIPVNEKIKQDSLDDLITYKFDSYRASIIKEKPFLFYIKSPIIHLKKFLVHSGAQYLFDESIHDISLFKLAVKCFYSFCYWTILILGISGGIWALFIEGVNKFKSLVVFGLPIYSIIIHSLIFKSAETRYLLPSFPFLIVFTSFMLHHLFELNRKKIKIELK